MLASRTVLAVTNDVSYIGKADHIILDSSEEVFITIWIVTEAATLGPKFTSKICGDAFAAHRLHLTCWTIRSGELNDIFKHSAQRLFIAVCDLVRHSKSL